MKSKFLLLAAPLLAALALAPIPATAQQAKPRPEHPPQRNHEQQRSQFLTNLRAHIRHVIVIYQENRSFDSYFGTFPGADNLATAEARSHGFRQYDPIGKTWVTPFAIATPDTADPNHAREVLIAKSADGHMDRFVSEEEENLLHYGAPPAYARQLGLLSMAHADCCTIPFLWLYARHFALYDHIFQAMYGPSTPGNIDIIAGQTGRARSYAGARPPMTAPAALAV